MKNSKMLGAILIMSALLSAMLGGCGRYGSPTEDTQLVGIALCANEDWPEYPVAQKLEQRLLDTGKYRVDLENAGEDADLQYGQARIMVADDACAIVITYVEGADESKMLTMIKAADIPLVEIDRDACKEDPDGEAMRLFNEVMAMG
ncbi:MAG: hypothetical protein Q4A32_06505 [Lachnospiraceae bacterium]|nr:hypothetical protein [Lachnospiraceae bacterium]